MSALSTDCPVTKLLLPTEESKKNKIKRHKTVTSLVPPFEQALSKETACQLKYLRDQGLQKPLHSQGANFKTLGVPFQQDGGGGGSHGLCWVEGKKSHWLEGHLR